MIPLEVIFALLDRQRAETIELAERGEGRDAFAFGSVHGRFAAIADFREALNDFVEQHQRGSDDHG